MSERIFITGIGTGVGKTLTAACITEALNADYWKPVQTGLIEGTDTDTVLSLLSNTVSVCHPEAWRLQAPASPHLAARLENTAIDTTKILTLADQYQPAERPLVIEGAGGLMVPVNETVFTLDLILALKARVVIVAQNYLGSINHSLLTARMLQHTGVPVIGWVFSGEEHSNEADIVAWSGYPKIGRIPLTNQVDKAFVQQQAQLLTSPLHTLLA
ncbi:MAG: dethiobiotin synthase [Chitinophaga sp.]|uniref:dethiobiotin synthase n=1 Tax=Chitinophaga sp. TaxID=1869181 RepID=UPI001B11A70B|nr:dethiobiotin synthase [Chitinophaga sp.]MBO9730940.1 dethiobiotin synthase [Chitinophaga sp.]